MVIVSIAMIKTLACFIFLRAVFIMLLSGTCVAQERVAIDGRPRDCSRAGQVGKPWRKSNAAAQARRQVLRTYCKRGDIRCDRRRGIARCGAAGVYYEDASVEVASALRVDDRYAAGAVTQSATR